MQLSETKKSNINYFLIVLLFAAVLVLQKFTPDAKYLMGSVVIAITVTLFLGFLAYKRTSKNQRRMYFLEGTLDAVQLPITVTDMDMR